MDTKTCIRDAKRRARLAETVEEQRALQEDLKNLERQQRRQRQAIFDVEDEIEARRDQLIEALEKRMKKEDLGAFALSHPLAGGLIYPYGNIFLALASLKAYIPDRV